MKLFEKKHLHFLILLLVILGTLVYVQTNGIGKIFDIAYNLFVLLYCLRFVRTDYGTEQLSVSKAVIGRSVPHQVLHGIGYGSAFAIVVIAALTLTMGLQPELQSYSIPVILWWIVARGISAFGEEAFFRYYFYATLRSFQIPVWLSVGLISLLYGAEVLITQQNLAISILAVAASVFLFWLRLSKQRESFLTLSVCHWLFNFYFQYIFLTIPM